MVAGGTDGFPFRQNHCAPGVFTILEDTGER